MSLPGPIDVFNGKGTITVRFRHYMLQWISLMHLICDRKAHTPTAILSHLMYDLEQLELYALYKLMFALIPRYLLSRFFDDS